MKKVLMSMAVVAAMVAFVSCSGNNKKKAEDKKTDDTPECCEGQDGCCDEGDCEDCPEVGAEECYEFEE